ncbi:Hypothetical predicted protein, partial [Paramuricea clavata]
MNLSKKVVYHSEVYCKCAVCKSRDGKNEGRWECLRLECGCEKKVIFVVKRVRPDSNEMMLTYECGTDECGFKIAAHDANCKPYVAIVQIIAPYLFWHTREKCGCDEYTKLAVERVTAGKDVSDPTKERSIQLKNEIQPIYLCAMQKCTYRKSIPQIVSHHLRCVCNKPMIYLAEKEIYCCAELDGGCGSCFHEFDTLTYVCTELAREGCIDSPWCTIPRVAKTICGQKGILKYRLFENFNFHGELIYECRNDDTCTEVLRDINIPAVFFNGEEI